MGEAKRRRAEIAELKMLRVDELAAMGCVCAWDGCTNSYARTPDGQPPPGWRILYLLKRYAGGELPNGEPVLRIFSPQAGIERDCNLCPKHAKQMDELLKPLHRELMGDAQGTA